MRFVTHSKIAVKVLPFVVLVVLLKLAARYFGLEVLSLSPLFSGVIGATVFLLGFMIAGTLGDFKESERLPGELAASLHSVADECRTITATRSGSAIISVYDQLDVIARDMLTWLRTGKRPNRILDDIEGLNGVFARLTPFTETTYMNRLKGEQNQMRRLALRIRTIRETSFVGTGYAIAELSTIILLAGLILTKGQPFMESLFFLGFISFVLMYMIALIADLDNPFDYSTQMTGYEVSLNPLEQFRKRLAGHMKR